MIYNFFFGRNSLAIWNWRSCIISNVVINFELQTSRSCINVSFQFEYVLACALPIVILYILWWISSSTFKPTPYGTPYFRNPLRNPLSNALLEFFISEETESYGGMVFFKMLIYASIITFWSIHYTLIYNNTAVWHMCFSHLWVFLCFQNFFDL